MAVATGNYASVKLDGVSPRVGDVLECAQNSIARALRDYPVTEKPSFHPSCSFSAENLTLALEEMQKHLGVSNILQGRTTTACRDDSDDASDARTGPPAAVLKAAWVYCNTPQEVAILSYLIRELDVEHLYLGVTVHLATSASDNMCLDESVGNDVAATCAAMDLLLRELRNQSCLRYLRVDFNVLATSCSPFEPMTCHLVGNEAVCQSIDLLTEQLRALVDYNIEIKTFKLGLHQCLYELFDAPDMRHVRRRLEKRTALLLGRDDRAGARSPLAEVPVELVQHIMDLALPMDQSVEVLPLRK